MNKDTTQQKPGAGSGNPVQGEGDYEASRRYRKDVENFVEHADIDRAAHEAAPQDAKEAKEMEAAEAEGRKHAKGGAAPKK